MDKLAFGLARLDGNNAPQTDLRSMILRMKYWQPVAVTTLVAERHSYARWRPGRVAFGTRLNRNVVALLGRPRQIFKMGLAVLAV